MKLDKTTLEAALGALANDQKMILTGLNEKLAEIHNLENKIKDVQEQIAQNRGALAYIEILVKSFNEKIKEAEVSLNQS